MQNNKSIPEQLAEAMASEHTSYKSTKKYLKRLPTTGRHVIQGPGENAGIVDIGAGWALAFRVESHNHPSFIKPYHGAASGVGGILRDIFTMGARPIALLDILRFGTDAHAKRLQKEVVRGISEYGNCVGVPVVGGDIFYDKTYNHNCLVNVAAFGLVKKKNIIYGQALTPGSDLIYIGARTGRDGVGGAQMASETLNSMREEAIQHADPYLEKLLLDACNELAQTNWIEGMQDMGAAGVLCSTSEVVLRGRKRTKKDLGAKVYLNRVPLKARGMSPIEILLSESQERMMIVGKKQHRGKILKLFKHWDLEARVVGTVTNTGTYTIVYDEGRKKNLTLRMQFDDIFPDVEEDWPLKKWVPQRGKHVSAKTSTTAEAWHQYDWMVGTRTLKGPNKPGHYAVLDLPEVKKELVIAWSSDEGRSDANPTLGTRYAFIQCLKRMNQNSTTPLALVNCLNFGHPKNSMGAFEESVDTLAALCRKHGVPVVGGNVSLYNAHKDHSIKPTPVLIMVGVRNATIRLPKINKDRQTKLKVRG